MKGDRGEKPEEPPSLRVTRRGNAICTLQITPRSALAIAAVRRCLGLCCDFITGNEARTVLTCWLSGRKSPNSPIISRIVRLVSSCQVCTARLWMAAIVKMASCSNHAAASISSEQQKALASHDLTTQDILTQTSSSEQQGLGEFHVLCVCKPPLPETDVRVCTAEPPTDARSLPPDQSSRVASASSASTVIPAFQPSPLPSSSSSQAPFPLFKPRNEFAIVNASQHEASSSSTSSSAACVLGVRPHPLLEPREMEDIWQKKKSQGGKLFNATKFHLLGLKLECERSVACEGQKPTAIERREEEESATRGCGVAVSVPPSSSSPCNLLSSSSSGPPSSSSTSYCSSSAASTSSSSSLIHCPSSSHHCNASSLTLYLGLTDYKEYMYSLSLPPPTRHALVWHGIAAYGNPFAHFSCALGCQAVVETRDGMLVFMRRSQHVAAYPGYYQFAGAGHPEPSEIFPVLRKISEEGEAKAADVLDTSTTTAATCSSPSSTASARQDTDNKHGAVGNILFDSKVQSRTALHERASSEQPHSIHMLPAQHYSTDTIISDAYSDNTNSRYSAVARAWSSCPSAMFAHECFISVLREIADEVNLPMTCLSPPLLMGVTTDLRGKPDMGFLVSCSLTWPEVLHCYCKDGGGSERFESDRLVSWPANELMSCDLPLSPAAQALRYLYLTVRRHHWS